MLNNFELADITVFFQDPGNQPIGTTAVIPAQSSAEVPVAVGSLSVIFGTTQGVPSAPFPLAGNPIFLVSGAGTSFVIATPLQSLPDGVLCPRTLQQEEPFVTTEQAGTGFFPCRVETSVQL